MKTVLSFAFLGSVIFCSCDSNSKGAAAGGDNLPGDSTNTSLVYLQAAGSPNELLCQHWQDSEDVADGILSSSSGSPLEIPFHDFSFFKDGVMVKNARDFIKTGKWVYDKMTKHIIISYDDASKEDYKVKEIGLKSLVLQPASGKGATYTADGKQHINVKDEPFYPTNNGWRIKPANAETDAGIKQRVISCLLFYNKFLQDNIERKHTAISFYGLPTCFKWYAGGISIINKKKIGQKWIDCFYNEEQAIKAQQLLENNITKKYNWKKEERHWVRQSADVLLQMVDSIK